MRLAVMVMTAAATALLTACGSANVAVTSAQPLPKGVFVSEFEHGSGDTGGGNGTFLSLFDQTSGRHLRDLVHLEERSALHLFGYSRGMDGTITYALGQGPHYLGHVAGGAPQAGTCGGTVYQVDARTGQTRTLFTVGKDRTIGAPSASPDGKWVAYLSQACSAGLAQSVTVRDLASGAEHTIGVPGAIATRVGWRSDSAQLVVTVMFSVQRSAADGPGFVVVPVEASGPQPRVSVQRAPDSGCVVEAAVFASSGIQLVEGCPDTVTGPARLVQLLDAGPRVLWRANTGLCPNGMTLAHDPEGPLLVTATTTCGGPGAPVDVVQSWTGQQVREIGRYVNPEQFVVAAG